MIFELKKQNNKILRQRLIDQATYFKSGSLMHLKHAHTQQYFCSWMKETDQTLMHILKTELTSVMNIFIKPLFSVFSPEE